MFQQKHILLTCLKLRAMSVIQKEGICMIEKDYQLNLVDNVK